MIITADNVQGDVDHQREDVHEGTLMMISPDDVHQLSRLLDDDRVKALQNVHVEGRLERLSAVSPLLAVANIKNKLFNKLITFFLF